jgi:predicted Zn-dependent protease
VTIQEAEILEKMDKWPEASEKYSEAISNGIGGNQFVFQYARSLIKIGEPKEKEKALDVLEKLSTSEAKNEKEEFWKRMAQAALSAEKGNPVVN